MHTKTTQTGDLKGIAEIKEALQLAKRQHAGQLRAIGRDEGKLYFDTHILRVVAAVPEDCKAAAALHDVLEDTGCQAPGLSRFRVETQLAVKLLTRQEQMSYEEYIEFLAGGWRNVVQERSDYAVTDTYAATRIALRVKLADLADNLATWPEGSYSRRYIKALGKVAATLPSYS